MIKEQDYLKDIADIRAMMERSTKFASLSGLAGVMAGIYALAGAFIVSNFYSFNPTVIQYTPEPESLLKVIVVALLVLVFTLSTTVLLSYKKAKKSGEKIWNITSKRLLADIAVPLSAGGILVVVFLLNGMIGLLAPITLVFYGLAIYNTSKFTFAELKFLGLFLIGLGLISSFFIEYSMFYWAVGFGVVHIVYGVYMHFKYER